MEDKRLLQVFRNIQRKSLKSKNTNFSFNNEFDAQSFIQWYKSKINELENKCAYCNSDQNKITELINAGVIKSKRFNHRGKNLEVDRKDPYGNYSPENCTLICYFCNNDKSDVFSFDDYMNYFINIKCDNNKTPRQNFIDEKYQLINKK